MDLDPSSSPLAFFIGEVKRLREREGMTQEQLADEAGYAPSTVAAIESSRLLPSAELAECFDRALHADGHLIRVQKLVEMTSVLPWFRDRVEVERKAHEIREYEPYQVPGLLQTENYARASISADRPMLAEGVIENAVALRMARQEILKLDHELPPESSHGYAKRLWAIIDESALHRVVGGPQIMRAQRDHLAYLALQPHITIQVMPFSAGITWSSTTCGRSRWTMDDPSSSLRVRNNESGMAEVHVFNRSGKLCRGGQPARCGHRSRLQRPRRTEAHVRPCRVADLRQRRERPRAWSRRQCSVTRVASCLPWA